MPKSSPPSPTTPSAHSDIEAMRFEDVLAAMEQIAAQLESGELDLAEALAAYGRGAALLKRAQSLLDEAAQTIELIDSQGSHAVVSRDQLESP